MLLTTCESYELLHAPDMLSPSSTKPPSPPTTQYLLSHYHHLYYASIAAAARFTSAASRGVQLAHILGLFITNHRVDKFTIIIGDKGPRAS